MVSSAKASHLSATSGFLWSVEPGHLYTDLTTLPLRFNIPYPSDLQRKNFLTKKSPDVNKAKHKSRRISSVPSQMAASLLLRGPIRSPQLHARNWLDEMLEQQIPQQTKR